MIKKIIKKIFNFTNFRIVHKNDWYERQVNLIPEISKDDLNFIKNLEKYSMCPPAAHWSIIQSINYISKKKIPGDFVECGIWRGGNILLYKFLNDHYLLDKSIFGYDTFEGMTEPEKVDVDYKGHDALQRLNNSVRDENIVNIHCYSSIASVSKNIQKYKNLENQLFSDTLISPILLN